MSLQLRVLQYTESDDEKSVILVLEAKYKEFNQIIASPPIEKGDKSVELILEAAKEACRPKIKTFLCECKRKVSAIGRYIPIESDFVPTLLHELSVEHSLAEQELSSSLTVEQELSSSLSVEQELSSSLSV